SRSRHRAREALPIPERRLLPQTRTLIPRPELREESLIAQALANRARAFEKRVATINRRRRSIGAQPPDRLGVVPEDRRLHVLRADQVIRHEEELLLSRPAMPLGDTVKLRLPERRGMAIEEEVQDRHEVALSRTEAPVKVGRLA